MLSFWAMCSYPRMKFLADTMTGLNCNQNSSQANDGLHNLIISVTQAIRELVQMPRVTNETESFKFILERCDARWSLGLLKSSILYQYEVQTALTSNTITCTIGFLALLFVIWVQYFVLVSQSRKLLLTHHGILDIGNRILEISSGSEISLRRRKSVFERPTLSPANSPPVSPPASDPGPAVA